MHINRKLLQYVRSEYQSCTTYVVFVSTCPCGRSYWFYLTITKLLADTMNVGSPRQYGQLWRSRQLPPSTKSRRYSLPELTSSPTQITRQLLHVTNIVGTQNYPRVHLSIQLDDGLRGWYYKRHSRKYALTIPIHKACYPRTVQAFGCCTVRGNFTLRHFTSPKCHNSH